MRSIFIAWLAVISPCLVCAQLNTPSVVNSTGIELPTGKSSFTLSIGEPVITTLTSSSALITQGYLQPIDKIPCAAVEFTYYPNPAKEYLIIEPKGCDDQIESVQIFDLWGRSIDTIAPKTDNKIHLDELSQGLYAFRVRLKGGTIGSFSAIKVSN